MSTRIYNITRGNASRLVRATSQAQALRHVAQSEFAIRVANQEDLVRALQAGGTVEEAGADAEADKA